MFASKKNLVVFYDDPCIDGAASAAVLHEVFANHPGWHVTYVPLSHGKPLERTQLIFQHLHNGDEAIFVDTSPKDDTLEYHLYPRAETPRVKKITIIDHHASEVARLRKFAAKHGMKPGAPRQKNGIVFDFILDPKKPSAALMAWEHYHPRKAAPPALLSFIGLMEPPVLLKKRCDFQKAAYIDAQLINTPEHAFETIGKLLAMPLKDMTALGLPIFRQQMQKLRREFMPTLRYAQLEYLPGHWGWMPLFHGNVKDYGRAVNVVMMKAAKDICQSGMAGAWYDIAPDTVKLSLRSCGEPNVGKVANYLAQMFGTTGGGHATDAAVFIDKPRFLQEVTLVSKAEMQAACALKHTAPVYAIA